MGECIGWHEAFVRNMDALGAPLPSGLFESHDKAIATLGALLAAAKVNPGASAYGVLTQQGAGPALIGLAGLSAASYAGLIAGSMLVASYQQMRCSTGMALYNEMTTFLEKNNISDSFVIMKEVMNNPMILTMQF